MKFLSSHREQQIIGYIEQARLEHALEMEEKEAVIVAAVKEIALLQDALKEAIRLQRDITQAWAIAREDPDADLDWDLDEMLIALNDQIATLEEHTV